jgi:pSer/pThr/pTyr-binding forkhead associated (FHA) protein
MKHPPVIVVQLIHIFGPMKGQIQEFSEGRIDIGRHQSCHLCFPADLTAVSRKHAEIIREGNQFKLIDHSANGTFVNGEKVKETYLKNGDVLTFAEGGPKVSFLTQLREQEVENEIVPQQVRKEELIEKPVLPKVVPKDEKKYIITPPPVIEEPPQISIQPVKVPLTIQYGPTIRSFKELPVTIGRSPKCSFVMTHPAIFDLHVQIFFSGNQYWIKDLTGQNLIRINHQPIALQVPINLDDEIALSPKGPFFRFLGEGRLAEISESPIENVSAFDKKQEFQERDVHDEKASKGFISKFKKFLGS